MSLSDLSHAYAREVQLNPIVRERSTPSTLRYSQSAPYESRAGSFGVGLSTINPGLYSFPTFGAATSITGLLALTAVDLIQAIISLPQTSPFNLAAMAMYKRIFIEAQNVGIHLGAGAGLGSSNDGFGAAFAMNYSLIAGIHFRLPGIPQLEAHLDGGASYSFTNTSPSTTINFALSALSPALGLSVFYLF